MCRRRLQKWVLGAPEDYITTQKRDKPTARRKRSSVYEESPPEKILDGGRAAEKVRNKEICKGTRGGKKERSVSGPGEQKC